MLGLSPKMAEFLSHNVLYGLLLYRGKRGIEFGGSLEN